MDMNQCNSTLKYNIFKDIYYLNNLRGYNVGITDVSDL